MAVQWYESSRNNCGSVLISEVSNGLMTCYEGSDYSTKTRDGKVAANNTFEVIAAKEIYDFGAPNGTYQWYFMVALEETVAASGYLLTLQLKDGNSGANVVCSRGIFLFPGSHYECWITGDTPADRLTTVFTATVGTPLGIMATSYFNRATLANAVQINSNNVNDPFPDRITNFKDMVNEIIANNNQANNSGPRIVGPNVTP